MSMSEERIMIIGPTAITSILALPLFDILMATISDIFPDMRHAARSPIVTAVFIFPVSISSYPSHSLNRGISTVIACITKVVDIKATMSSHTTGILSR